MEGRFSRRQFIQVSLPAFLFLFARRAVGDDAARHTIAYRVDLGVLFNLFTFELSGSIRQEIDRPAGRYRCTIAGEGAGTATHVEARGIIRAGRFMPVETRSFHTLRGRESRLALTYHYERGLAEYHAVGHTLLLGRRRQVDDVVPLPAGQPVDDAISASLNFAAGKLDVDAAGAYHTNVLRRKRPEDEGPDDVSPGGYRVEIVPFRFRVSIDPATGRLTSLIDLTRWSSWARSNRPARVIFGADRRPESLESSLILGSTLKVRLT